LTWQERKQETIPVGAYIQSAAPQIVTSLSGRFIGRGVSVGELVSADLIVSGEAGFMALAIRPGMRAISIRTSAVQMAGGFVQPEDRLDVIHTVVRDLDGDGIANGISETILHNVRVLAVGDVPTKRTTESASLEQDGPDKTVKNSETVTLELTDEQARLLISAGTSGVITFALRPVGNPTLAPQIGSVRTLGENRLPGVRNEIRAVPAMTIPSETTAVRSRQHVITVISPSGRAELSVAEGGEQ
jgi:pilus assembly protein CpaB